MEFTGKSLDAVLFELYRALVANGQYNVGSRGGTYELISVTLHILKPRARLSISENRGKAFSALGELLWYLSGSNALEFIEPYVPPYGKDAVDGILEGAYGPRLLNMRKGINQFDSIHQLLTEKPGSRRAVIQLFNAEDIATPHREIPCTTTMQFHLRNGALHMSVTMRSNDAYWGLPHDVFCFTMIQEMMARRLGVEMGEYHQYVGSMHVYEDYWEKMKEYIVEGFQQTREMPPMPKGNHFDMVGRLLEIEGRLRVGEAIVAADEIDDPYWADIVRLLQAFWARKWVPDHSARLIELKGELASEAYGIYLEGRRHLEGQVPNAGDAQEA
ncbi:thymidylate synthase [Novosphingobium rosa]|uniref:thymidylate synthase n=1 Tax=Novosphingobium rosa TaxID=76978 RepID=UPI00083597A3|nr:thymidylate synthase [Novosphingobium rosa]